MDINEEELKEKCPNLYKELKNSPSLSIDGIRKTDQKGENEKKNQEESRDYSTNFPSVIDHLLGCSTDEEALEIIDFFEKKDELDTRFAKKMREQIKKRGIRSFGEKRKKGSIEKNGLDY